MIKRYALKRMMPKAVVGLCCFLSLCLLLEGCQPLRKKFTRKKKEEKIVEDIPLLEPIDYPSKIYVPTEVYRHHFSLWKLWQKEIINALSVDSNRKRQLYALDQAIANLEAAAGQLTGEVQEKLLAYVNKLKAIDADMRASVPRQSSTSFKTNLELLEKRIRREFSLDKVQGSLKSS